MAKDIGRGWNKTVRLPVVLKAAVTFERTDGPTSPVVEPLRDISPEPQYLISFNPLDLEDYRYAIRQLQAAVLVHHGPNAFRRLLQEETPSTKRALQEATNDRLLAEFVRSGLTVRKFAAKLAEKDESLNPKSLEKQIDRLKDKIRDPRRRKHIEWLASQLAQWVPEGR
jgi:hypothetical protein